MTDFGTRLKQARKQKGMTQKELAVCLGVEQSAVSNYEKNFRQPAASSLLTLAEHLDVTVEYLLGAQDHFKPTETSQEVSDFISVSQSDELKSIFEPIQKTFFEMLLNRNYSDAYEWIKDFGSGSYSLFDLYQYIFEPTLIRVGEMWETGELSVAEEHIISDLLDRVMVAIGETMVYDNLTKKSYRAAFMLPGSEQHQFPLKMTAEIFKAGGWGTYYIGKSIPLFSLEQFLRHTQVDVLVLSVMLKEHLNSCEAVIRAVKTMALEKKPLILVGGTAIDNVEIAKQILGADYYLKSLSDLKADLVTIEAVL